MNGEGSLGAGKITIPYSGRSSLNCRWRISGGSSTEATTGSSSPPSLGCSLSLRVQVRK
jgi:hypothetical protein